MQTSGKTWAAPVTVTAAAVATPLIAANASRTRLRINNQTDKILYVRYAAVATPATATSYDLLVPPRTTQEVPDGEVPITALNGIGEAGASGTWVVNEATA